MEHEKQTTFTVPAILSSVAFTKDGGLRLSFATNELSSEEKVAIAKVYGNFGWLAFRPNAIEISDMPLEDAEDKSKTPSKRLRAVLYVLAKQRNVKDFEPWYREQVEKVIDRIKLELE